MQKEAKAPRTLSLPKAVITQIQDETARIDRSPSWIAGRAWEAARPELSKLAGPGAVGQRIADLAGAGQVDRQDHAIHLPLSVISEQDRLAAELDSSPSELMHLAWLLGRGSISDQPSSDP
jgi:uncharacterized small protein (TIGR04563 family)